MPTSGYHPVKIQYQVSEDEEQKIKCYNDEPEVYNQPYTFGFLRVHIRFSTLKMTRG